VIGDIEVRFGNVALWITNLADGCVLRPFPARQWATADLFHEFVTLPLPLGSPFRQKAQVSLDGVLVSAEFRLSLHDGELDPQGDDWVGDVIAVTTPTDEVDVGQTL
jgi:hypothetical protein